MNWQEKWSSYSVHDDKNIKGFFGQYRWLSNFHQSPVELNGLRFGSVEAAYQSAKVEANEPERVLLYQRMNPLESKKAGNKETLPSNWEEVKYKIMEACVRSKFSLDDSLRVRLLETGDKYIEETNHWGDVYWGVCAGVGKNHLGKIIMKVRLDFRQRQ
jgi:ribA/ribD-fused uncharacterized protein